MKQALASGDMTAKDINDMEQAMGMDLEGIVAMSSQLSELNQTPKAREMLDMFKQLVAVKKGNRH